MKASRGAPQSKKSESVINRNVRDKPRMDNWVVRGYKMMKNCTREKSRLNESSLMYCYQEEWNC